MPSMPSSRAAARIWVEAMLALDPLTISSAAAAFQRGGAAADTLITRADAALVTGPWSVMDKQAVPPSGDKHDFMSLGTYWWPDPDRADGRPYIRRDGHTNPEIELLDRPRLSLMADAVALLAAAVHLTRKQVYAERAALLLRTWFLDPATRMNPHLRFGQGIPGRCDGRCIGIIDSECLVRVCDAIVLLRQAGLLPPAVDAGMTAWLGTYLDWLLTDPLGIAEAAEGNNHGSCYDVQVVALAQHVGRRDVATRVLAAVPSRRLATQIEADGRMPHELARTKAWSYSLKNLMALLNLAGWSGRTVWDWRGADGRSLPAALDWLLPFALGRQAWQHQELGGFHGRSLTTALLRASQLDGGGRYTEALHDLCADPGETALQTLAGFPLGAVGTIGGRRGFHG
jgi:hypothetical protein